MYQVNHRCSTKQAEVKIEPGKPDAVPGGPYKGGIAGGALSEIQFRANETYEDIDASGNPATYDILGWQWTFSGRKGSCLELDNHNKSKNTLQYVEAYIENADSWKGITAAFWMKLFDEDGGAGRSLISYAIMNCPNEFLMITSSPK